MKPWIWLAVGALALGCSRAPESRVLVLAMDGLDPVALDTLLAEGEMPNFARLRRGGAYGRLRSQKPLLSPIVWTTVATGRTPDVHGISHFVAQDPATGEQIPVTRDMRRVRAVWNVVSDAGREVAIVGWWATWPPEEVAGVVVSDHTAYHFLFDEGLAGEVRGDETYPPSLMEEIAPKLIRPGELPTATLARFVRPLEASGASGDTAGSTEPTEFDFDDELSHLRWALATAESYRHIGLDLWRQRRPALEMVYFEVTDSAAHLFGHLYRRDDLVGELAVQQARFGDTVEEVYRYADELLGTYLDELDDDTTLVVLSDHGFQLGVLHEDPSRTRDLRRVSERFHREDGVLYLYGNRVRAGRRLEAAGILDVTPTLLALLDLPAAQDMPGRVLEEALDLEPVPRVATYEGGATPAGGIRRDRATEEATLKQLRALGYLDTDDDDGTATAPPADTATASPEGLRNLAAIQFEAGRLQEALEIYRRLAVADPGDAAIRTSLAGTLGALGRFAEAHAELLVALELDPLNVEAYHNRGVIEERLGDAAAAIASYRTALRYAPTYEPSARALVRLGVPVTGARAMSPRERRAAELSESAADAARRGDYAAAMSALEEAEALAPDLALVHQYRSNVAFLMGDTDGAIRALERGLELEPDNELFKRNLDNLRARLQQ